MIEHIPDLVEAGISSLKIEGRMKSVFYVSSVVGAYRRALDAYEKDPKNYVFNPSWRKDLSRASHRQFTTGFFYHKPDNEDQNYRSSDYMRECTFIGVVRSYDPETRKNKGCHNHQWNTTNDINKDFCNPAQRFIRADAEHTKDNPNNHSNRK